MNLSFRELMQQLDTIVWPAVISVVASVLAVVVALRSPESQELVIALGFTSVSMGLLAQRG